MVGSNQNASKDGFAIYSRRYIGSKARLVEWIYKEVSERAQGSSFFDVFAGTGVVSSRFLESQKRLVLNDFLHSNNVIYKAFLQSNDVDLLRIAQLASEIEARAARSKSVNYFSENFGGKFFSIADARKIGFIRQRISKMAQEGAIDESEFNVLLASLILSADRSANTVGHYDAYRRRSAIEETFHFRLVNPLNTRGKTIEIYREDSNALAPRVTADIAFIDPPYNSRQYSRFYHVLENLAEWKKPTLYGTALKPKPENMSDYCRVSAPESFASLIRNLHCRYLVVTYNNTFRPKSSSSRNKIPLEFIENCMNDVGPTTMLNTNHRHFNSGKTEFDNHREYLFITKVR